MNIIQIIITLILSIFGYNGVYFADFDYMACDSPRACMHEEGHRLDNQLGRPSQTKEFKDFINKNFLVALENTSCIIESESCLYSEAYAGLYSAVGSNLKDMPDEFIRFYKE